jgi:hypothetical protein
MAELRIGLKHGTGWFFVMPNSLVEIVRHENRPVSE